MSMRGWIWPSLQRHWLLVLLACLAIGAALSIHMGQDASWDLRNYHLYNAWAWLNDRENTDVAAASLQSFFNPIMDVPYYLLMAGPLEQAPRWLAAIQGLWYGLLVFFVYRITMTMARLQDRSPGLPDWLAIAIGATGTMAVSQAGLTSNEIPVACLVLASAACVLHTLACRHPKPSLPWLLSGLLAGLAAGLKPTAIVYPVAAGLAALLTLRPRRLAAGTFLLFASGGGIGFLLTYGAWAWHLYHATGNPVFPMFNQVFHSSWGPPGSMTDRRFMPRDIGQWLFYPFYWLRRTQSIVTEVRFADPRYALSFLAVLTLALTALRRRAQDATPANLALAWLAGFWIFAYLGWLLLFSILRYAVPLEALSGVLVLNVARRLWPAPKAKAVSRVLGISLLACLSLTHYPDWGRVPFSRRTLELKAPQLPDHSLVLLVGMPVAYLAPFLPKGVDVRYAGVNWFVGASRGRRLYDEVSSMAQGHRGPLYALYSPEATQADRSLVLQLLPNHQNHNCQPIGSSLERDRRGRPNENKPELCELLDSATTRD